MNSEHSKWMKTTEIQKLKGYILKKQNNVDPNFVNIRSNVDTYLREIIRFLILKSIHGDFNASQLSPLSKEIDDVWHCFLLHTQDYQSFVNKMTLQFCKESHFIHHNPMGAFETSQKQERLERTKLVYVSRYNTLPSIYLPLSTKPSTTTKRKMGPSEEITEEQRKAKKKHKSEESITFKIKNQRGEEQTLMARPSMLLGKVFHGYCQIEGLNPKEVRFMFDGKKMFPDETLAMHDVEDDDVIDCMLMMLGC